jgi:REP element-mobilizing transposase RayT
LYGKDGVKYKPPEWFLSKYRSLTGKTWDQITEDFNAKWQKMPEDELWDILFLEKIVKDCSEAIVEHPIKQDWIIKKFNFSEI